MHTREGTHTTPGSPAKAQPPGDLEHVQRDVRIRSKTSKINVILSFSCRSSPLPRTKNQYTSCAGFSFCAREGISNKAAAFMPQAISPVQQRRPQPAAETGRSCWDRVLIFQSPAKGAAEKSANATRTGASRQIPSRFPTRRNVYRDDCRFVVDGTGREPERAKAGYHHDGGILPFALICFISRSQHPLQYSLRENSP